MKRFLTIFVLGFCLAAFASAQEFSPVPRAWKWTGNTEVAFTYDGTYTDEGAFSVNAKNHRRTEGIQAPELFSDFPVKPSGAVNLTYSPDSTKLAFTRANDLYVVDIASGEETRLTFDGSDLILNGYASWVYYEEILGRPSRFKAFWWAPDSKKIGFYRFDNNDVPLFPIYSPYDSEARSANVDQSAVYTGLDLGGSLSATRYPKAGQSNPEVKIGIVDLGTKDIVWADFDPKEDQYFGTPFWGPDSQEFFISRMPRIQNTLDLYSVSVVDGSKKHIYKETYKTWLNWMADVIFTDSGLYMAREFETGWAQIYYLSYDGKTFRRLTDGTNWGITLQRVDEKKGDVYFTAKRDASMRHALYKVDNKGVIKALTDPAYNVQNVRFSPDGKYFAAAYSNLSTPTRVAVFSAAGGVVSEGRGDNSSLVVEVPGAEKLTGYVVADMKGPDFDASKYALGELVYMTTDDGFVLPGTIVYPLGFDASKKYPVHVDIYGGPDAPLVVDRWVMPNENNQWWSQNGIIQITVDPRAEGHNGRTGLDMIYKQMTVWELKDFVDWAEWLQAKPYVIPEKIGIEGFSYGGTMTCLLLMLAPDKYHYAISGGGVTDWHLYDTHYTERYMETPQSNPEGYRDCGVIPYVKSYPTEYGNTSPTEIEPVMLKLTHGTGDDNVHFQNTLLLLDEFHRHGKKIDFMIYPDGMHGYRGYQGEHFRAANRAFWLRYLLER